MNKKLSKQSKAEYIRKPHCCPYCGAVDVESDACSVDLNIATMPVNCLVCLRTWTEIFKLIDIKEDL